MEYRPFGRTGVMVSSLCLGAPFPPPHAPTPAAPTPEGNITGQLLKRRKEREQ